MRKFIIVLLCLCLSVIPLSVPAAEDSVRTLSISDAEGFLEFAENCRLDTYSSGLIVELTADIDLSGREFMSVPVFSGTFDGNGHTISGIHMNSDGSTVGVFRYLTEEAVVRNLNVDGIFTPSGSKSNVGGIAGSSSGIIDRCTFTGTVSGSDCIGGIAGINAAGGSISNCVVNGTVYGNHFVGGIAGENSGIISACRNYAKINNTPQHSSVQISDITVDSLTSSEYAATVTDAGGIAGTNTGSIRSSENHAAIGYRHMGYNVGGIAGSSIGYIYNCSNTGNISGRKEVGGIAGQIEPAAMIEYSTDTLQILEQQLGTMQYLTSSASQHAQNSAVEISEQLDVLQSQSQNAQNALSILLQNLRDPDNMNFDAVQSAYNSLNGSLNDMGETIQDISTTAEDGITELGGSLQAVSAQMNAIGETIDNAASTTGVSIQDVSDKDTALDFSAKIENCSNLGEIIGDLNAGGIAGSISIENKLDHEDDIEFSGNQSYNFDTKFRAVILSCRNSGSVTVKRQNAGGIVGWMSMGLVKNCSNTGITGGEGADYVGGITGSCSGYIRSCNAKCSIEGESFVGGIAGKASVMTDCRSMIKIKGGSEKTGEMIGFTEELNEIIGNYYRSADKDIGAIDGISYSGAAQPLDHNEFFVLDDLDSIFRTVNVDFVFEDGSIQSVAVAPGDSISVQDIPSIPEKEGYTAAWDGLNDESLKNIEFDAVYYAMYTRNRTVIESDQLHNDASPVLLVHGRFEGGEDIVLTDITDEVFVSDKQPVIEAWSYELAEGSYAELIRFHPVEIPSADSIEIFVGSDGQWKSVDFSINGRYIVFAVSEADSSFCIAKALPDYAAYLRIGLSILYVLIIVIVLIIRKIAKKKKDTH